MKNEKKVDLHIHSKYSDGVLSIKEIIQLAQKKNVDVMAITDHNNINHINDLKDIKNCYDLEVISGIELTAAYSEEIHLLGYFNEINESVMSDFLNKKANKNITYIFRLMKKLRNNNIIVSLEDAKEKEIYSIDSFIKNVLKKNNISETTLCELLGFESIDELLLYHRSSIEACINAIKKANGIVILAHPGKLKLNKIEFEELINKLIDLGLDGIECFHPSHTEKQESFFIGIAKKNNLIISGGSDYHGDDKHKTQLGEINMKYDFYKQFKTKLIGDKSL